MARIRVDGKAIQSNKVYKTNEPVVVLTLSDGSVQKGHSLHIADGVRLVYRRGECGECETVAIEVDENMHTPRWE